MNPEAIAKDILLVVQAEAEKKWGKKWVLELTRAYCEICRENDDEEANEHNRRRSIARVFEVYGCNLPTAIALAHCVDCRIQLTATRTEVLVP
jgi:hypothetical protein